MAWFKVDDKFHSHSKARKVIADDPAALALWVVAGSWSSDNLQDGFVPDHQLPWLIPVGADELARKLVTAGLWRRVRGGYQFHDFDDWNPTADEVQDLRKKRSEAGRRGGLASGKARSNSEASASASAEAKTKQKRTPSRPVPSQEELLSPDGDESDGFADFWKAYPPRKNNSKHKARLAYDAAINRGVDPAEILAALAVYAKDRQGEDPQYTKHAVTWLHARPWESPEQLQIADPGPRKTWWQE